jgi:hypothetical protein
MEWIKPLAGTIVAVDTAPLIYFIERHPRYFSTIDPFFEALDRRHFQAITSTLTLTEVLVLPLRAGNSSLASDYLNILTKSRNLVMLPVSEAIASSRAVASQRWVPNTGCPSDCDRSGWRRHHFRNKRREAGICPGTHDYRS